MSQFMGVLRHEFNLTLRRRGMWIAYLVLYIFLGVALFTPDVADRLPTFRVDKLWQEGAMNLFYANMFMVLLGGILAADRLQRDFRLGVRELQSSSPLSLRVYILGKYLGVLGASLVPMLVWVLIVGIYGISQGAPWYFIAIMLVAFLVMGLPAYAFVIAFSLACPLILPVRVYQVLFTGYWFWGNYLNPGVLPTISDTLLVPSGKYAMYGFFGVANLTKNDPIISGSPTLDAVLNLALLAASIAAVLFCLNRYLAWQARSV